MSLAETPHASGLKAFLGGRGADPNAAARRLAMADDEEARRGPDTPRDRAPGDEVERAMKGLVSVEVEQLAERRALAMLVAEIVRRKHAKRALPSAGDAAIAFQIADLLAQIAGSQPGPLDAAFGNADSILPDGPAINAEVDRAMRRGSIDRERGEEGKESAASPSEHPNGEDEPDPAP
jgi:hypothetical protein